MESRTGFYLIATAYGVLSLLACFGISAIAQRDAQISRANADHIAMKRQAKHARDQVVAAAQRSADMARLRHDLANQVGLVDRLVAQGQGAEADRYLTALQEQARELGRPVAARWQEPKELS